MYNEVIKNLELQLPNSDIKKIKNKNMHLGIFSEPYLTYLLDGKKTIESRFSKNRIAPYNQITKDDVVIVKKSSGNVLGYFTIKDVLFFDLNTIPIEEIKSKYNKYLYVNDDFWNLKNGSKYATLIIIDKLVNLNPFSINKKGMHSWIKLKSKNDV